MNKDSLINTIEIYCPACERIHSLEMRKRITQAKGKDEVGEYAEIYFLCPLCNQEENEFVLAELLDENLLKARNTDRKKKSL